MIFDYLDIATKRSLASNVKRWLEYETSLEQIKLLCRQHNIRGTKVATYREEEDLVRTLAMLAAGIIVPLRSELPDGAEAFGLAVRRDWRVPAWVFNENAWRNVMLHAEQILEALDMPVPAVRILPAVYARFRRHDMLACTPNPPHIDLQKDMEIQRQLITEGEAQETSWVNLAKRGLRRH
jgi:hypothetical protein